MIVPGNPKSEAVIERDIALKNELADQIHPYTYQERKAYLKVWLGAKCCADDCDRYCDECHGVRFHPVPHRIAKEFDVDIRRFMEKYQRFWLTSEQDQALKYMRGGAFYEDGRGISNQADSNDSVWDGERKGIGRSGQLKEDSGNPYQKQKESFLCSGSGGMAFEKSFEYWGQ